MNVGSCSYLGQSHLAVFAEGRVIMPALSGSAPSMLHTIWSLLDGGDAALAELRSFCRAPPSSCERAIDEVQWLAPIARPRKNIMCLGWNYREHVRESADARGKAVELPDHPIVFTKAVTTVCGPFDAVSVDEAVTTQLDWEVELAVIIGRGGKNISEARALDHVFGYTVINDLSARDVQFRHKQYFLGKSLDGTCPMGPWIVLADAIPDPQNLALRCRVNGVVKQDSHTSQQIFPVARIIAILSRHVTLDPGDIISTGTPAGVGFARTPPEFLQSGDVVECEIDGIGTLRNTIIKKK